MATNVGRLSIEGPDAERVELVQMIQMEVLELMIQWAEQALLAKVACLQQLAQVRHSWEFIPQGKCSHWLRLWLWHTLAHTLAHTLGHTLAHTHTHKSPS